MYVGKSFEEINYKTVPYSIQNQVRKTTFKKILEKLTTLLKIGQLIFTLLNIKKKQKSK